MKLMRKIALVFIAVTMLSSIAYYTIGQSIVNEASSGELDRGPGRTSGVMSRLDGDINKYTALVKEYGEYINISSKLEKDYGESKRKEILNIEKNISRAPISNMIIVDDNFKVYKEIKVQNIDIKSDEISNLLDQTKMIINSKENNVKGFFGGLVSTENLVYIVAAKRVEVSDNSNYVNIIITPLDKAYMEKLGDSADRNVSIDKKHTSFNSSVDEVRRIKDRDYYCVRNEESIDIYTDLELLGNGPDYLFHLKDTKEVRSSAIKTISMLTWIAVIVTLIANTISYFLVKKKVLERIIGINDVVNKVTNGLDLEIKLKEDKEYDEISTLRSDLNKMFGRIKSYSDNLEYIGSHDLLTGLTNRHNILNHISELKEKKSEFSVFFIDLDNFKGINDTLGHNIGDQLLCLVSKKLEKYQDEYITISRFGGDEFILVREGKNDSLIIDNLAANILKSLNDNLQVDKYAYTIKASMGISFYPQHSTEEVNLVQYSDIAMYRSKRNGGNSFTIFDDTMLEPLELEGRLKSAIEKEELEVYYQPIYGVNSKEIIGAEALVRWNTEEGIIVPDKFISLAKRTGDIIDIDIYVLKNAIVTCKEWIEAGKKDFYISVNISKLLLKSKNLLVLIKEELERNSVPSNALKLEITEDEIIDDFEGTIKILEDIRRMGVEVYLDDFGTGYSSFNHIKVLPVDVIKIDRSLLIDIQYNNKSKFIVETMINLCHNLGLSIVCEGIEEKEQVEMLKQLECDSIQGYFFSKPLPKDKFNNFVKEFK